MESIQISEEKKINNPLYTCINTMHYFIVDYCKKINNLQFSECGVIFRTNLVTNVINFLRNEFPEGYFYLNLLLKILNKMPEMFQLYYNVEIDNFEIIFNKIFSSISSEKQSGEGESEKFVNNKSENTHGNESIRNIFLEFIEKHVECVKDLLGLLKNNLEMLKKLDEIYKQIYENINVLNNGLDEEILKKIIEEYEKLIESSFIKLSKFSESEYLQNTFFPLMTQIADDTNTIKSLIKTYLSVLSIDPINTISNLLISKKNIEHLKKKYQNFFELKIYIFFIQFYYDNISKCTLILKTYFENKKLSLLQSFSECGTWEITSSDSELLIKEKVFFQSHSILYVDKYLKKCFEENLDINYFLMMFDKKRYLENFEISDKKDLYLKKIFISSEMMFIESDDDLSILAIFHTNSSDYKAILNEIGVNYKNHNSPMNNNFNETNYFNNNSNQYSNSFVNCNNKNNSDFNSFNLGQKENSYPLTQSFTAASSKFKVSNSKDYLLISKLSNYIFIAIKIKEKNPTDTGLINEICRDFRIKFANLHILKTIFSLNLK